MARSREITSQQISDLTARLVAAFPATAGWDAEFVSYLIKVNAHSYAEENRRYAKMVARLEQIEQAA